MKDDSYKNTTVLCMIHHIRPASSHQRRLTPAWKKGYRTSSWGYVLVYHQAALWYPWDTCTCDVMRALPSRPGWETEARGEEVFSVWRYTRKYHNTTHSCEEGTTSEIPFPLQTCLTEEQIYHVITALPVHGDWFWKASEVFFLLCSQLIDGHSFVLYLKCSDWREVQVVLHNSDLQRKIWCSKYSLQAIN